MARLQDFPSVTPTASDNLLIVQSQGQGLATFGTVMGAKLDKSNPTGTGSLSLNRKSGTTTGYNSVAEGTSNTSSGHSSHAEGYDNTASGNFSHVEGSSNTATADQSHAEGYTTTASGSVSHAEGVGTIANHLSQHVFGLYNVADTSTAAATLKGNYVEIVGKGTSDANRSNARTLDWQGNEVLAGNLTFNGNVSLTAALAGKKNISTVTVDDAIPNIAANTGGYLELDITIPTGYKTTGVVTFFWKHVASAYAVNVNAQVFPNRTGSQKLYVSYYSPIARNTENLDFYAFVLTVEE